MWWTKASSLYIHVQSNIFHHSDYSDYYYLKNLSFNVEEVHLSNIEMHTFKIDEEGELSIKYVNDLVGDYYIYYYVIYLSSWSLSILICKMGPNAQVLVSLWEFRDSRKRATSCALEALLSLASSPSFHLPWCNCSGENFINNRKVNQEVSYY